MASYVENFTSKLDWTMPFQRTGQFPLDRSSIFSSYADAVKYAKGDSSDPDTRELCGTSYVGQIITVYENSVVDVYKIKEDRTIEKIGSGTGVVDVDEKSIIKGSDGKLSIKGYSDATDGYMLVKSAEYGLSWVQPIDVSSLEQKVQAAAQSATQAEQAKTMAGTYATQAIEAAAQVESKFWYGTLEEYNALEEVKASTIYIILDE